MKNVILPVIFIVLTGCTSVKYLSTLPASYLYVVNEQVKEKQEVDKLNERSIIKTMVINNPDSVLIKKFGEKAKNGIVFILTNESPIRVEGFPEFPGGMMALKTYITQNLKYPASAQKEGIQGKVLVNFTVGKDGSIKDATIRAGVHPLLDAEAIRVVNSMPRWKPAFVRGEAVESHFTVPIGFAL